MSQDFGGKVTTTLAAAVPSAATLPAVAVARAFARPLPIDRTWSLGRLILSGLLTGGLWPLIVGPLRFRTHARAERRQYDALAGLRASGGADGAPGLTDAARTIGFSKWAYLWTWCFALAAAACVALHLQGVGWSIGSAASFVYGSFAPPGPPSWRDARPAAVADPLFTGYVVSLSIGFGLQYWQVNRHALATQRFVEAYNVAIAGHPAGPVRGPGFQHGLSGWVVVAMLAGAAAGVFWSIPMLAAGGSFRQYARRSSPRTRADLADRLQDVAAAAVDACPERLAPLTLPRITKERCINPACFARLPKFARFCPRCGHPEGARRPPA